MALWRGAKLAASLLLAPSGAGIGTHLLNTYYTSIMTFDGEFFLVQAVEDLFDTGIPHIPEDIITKAEEVAKQLQQAKQQEQQQQQQESQVQEQGSQVKSKLEEIKKKREENLKNQQIFGEKKYWCRYFEYSRADSGTGIKDVTMEYDPNCKIYKIFPLNKEDQNPQQQTLQVSRVSGGSSSSSSTSSSSSSIPQSQQKKSNLGPQVFDISQINTRGQQLKNLELKNNDDYQKGAFYLLKLDKSKITKANSMIKIELAKKPDNVNKYSENQYHEKITTLQLKAPLMGDKSQDVDFEFKNSAFPASLLLVKKSKAQQQLQIAQQAEGSSNQGKKSEGTPNQGKKAEGTQNQGKKEEEPRKVYELKNSTNEERKKKLPNQPQQKFEEKVGVNGIWRFPLIPVTEKGADLSGLDMRLMYKLDEKKYSELNKNDENKNSWGNLLLNLVTGIFTWGSEEYYLVGTNNKFWNYQVGDQIQLLESTQKNQSEQTSQVSDNSGGGGGGGSPSSSPSQAAEEKQLVSFEIVAGVVADKPLSSKCYSEKLGLMETFSFDLFSQRVQRRITNGSGNNHSWDPDENFCEPINESIPPSTIILVGRNSKNDSLVKTK
ncbi:hypothetical protein, weakly similar to ciliary adhesin protein P97 [Mycoplasma suis KI3806]|uniref:Uncharacterized protein n=1 Tax=Mycoplasma suis (strain KI_3806) TaxID=708248 RepID=F0V1I5_MYCS3|nr:hypothetical protein [Mycoplasma suis]CBZ40516.1 hypothetical protein, weakly similar to ciliary adhesin protein P97 [Mycoplasma suis KI3806]